jgi:RNA polymerase sigma factor
MRELDFAAQGAVDNNIKLEELIKKFKPFIIKSASAFAKRLITDNDDEWSISLLAFSEAVKNYNLEKGNFLSFSELVIKRRLLDFYNYSKKFNNEISVNPSVFSGENDEDDENTPVFIAVQNKITYTPENKIKDEIEAINIIFKNYGFTFFDLTECSPKAEKTKKACAKAVAFMCKNPLILKELRTSKQLPIKIIEKNINVPRKILERHRKYIIAAVEILSGEYPCIAEYLQPIREELYK